AATEPGVPATASRGQEEEAADARPTRGQAAASDFGRKGHTPRDTAIHDSPPSSPRSTDAQAAAQRHPPGPGGGGPRDRRLLPVGMAPGPAAGRAADLRLSYAEPGRAVAAGPPDRPRAVGDLRPRPAGPAR